MVYIYNSTQDTQLLYLFFSPFQNSFESITSSLYNINYNYSYLEVEEFLIVFIISQTSTPIVTHVHSLIRG